MLYITEKAQQFWEAGDVPAYVVFVRDIPAWAVVEAQQWARDYNGDYGHTYLLKIRDRVFKPDESYIIAKIVATNVSLYETDMVRTFLTGPNEGLLEEYIPPSKLAH